MGCRRKLSLTKSSNRNIWTIGTNYPSGINNFTTSNLSYLKNELYKGTTADTDANANKLINFIKGLDATMIMMEVLLMKDGN